MPIIMHASANTKKFGYAYNLLSTLSLAYVSLKLQKPDVMRQEKTNS
jgi:hypothetical protein